MPGPELHAAHNYQSYAERKYTLVILRNVLVRLNSFLVLGWVLVSALFGFEWPHFIVPMRFSAFPLRSHAFSRQINMNIDWMSDPIKTDISPSTLILFSNGINVIYF